MYSVTKRIQLIKQPYGGYVRPSSFHKFTIEDNEELFEIENINPGLVGIAVDYLTRFLIEGNKEVAFEISLLGAKRINQTEKALNLLNSVKGLDDESIICACKLAGYDVCKRASVAAYKPVEEINPDVNTIANIKIMVNRSMAFIKQYGPIVEMGITFEGGYTTIVSSGDADFMTFDTLWDFKVSRSKLRANQTLQIIMYYIMGMHSKKGVFKNIKNLGIYNPRKGIICILPISEIKYETIQKIESEVLAYEEWENNISEDDYALSNPSKNSTYELCKIHCTPKNSRPKRTQKSIQNGKPKSKEQSKKNSYVIAQYTVNGELIKTFNSYKEIQEIESVGKNGVSNNIRGISNTYHGFVWKKYSSNDEAPKHIEININKKEITGMPTPIRQMDRNGKIVNEYSSMKEASRETNISYSGIKKCVNEKQKSAGGFIWEKIS